MAKNDIWITNDGVKLKMCEMTDGHLRNAINYFIPENKLDIKSSRWKVLKCEARRRGWEVNDKTGIIPPPEPIEDRWEILDL